MIWADWLLLCILLGVLSRALFNAVASFGGDLINLQMHPAGSYPLLYSACMLAVCYLLDRLRLPRERIGHPANLGLSLFLSLCLWVAFLATRGNYADVLR